MSERLNLGFDNQKREVDYPFRTTFRCGEDTTKQLLDIKSYCTKHTDIQLESTSTLIRKAIQFGSVFCQMQSSQLKEEKHAKVKK